MSYVSYNVNNPSSSSYIQLLNGMRIKRESNIDSNILIESRKRFKCDKNVKSDLKKVSEGRRRIGQEERS